MELQMRTKAPMVLEAVLGVATVSKAEAKWVSVFCSSEHCFVPFFSLTEAAVGQFRCFSNSINLKSSWLQSLFHPLGHSDCKRIVLWAREWSWLYKKKSNSENHGIKLPTWSRGTDSLTQPEEIKISLGLLNLTRPVLSGNIIIYNASWG